MVIKTYNPVTLEEKETVSKIQSIIFNRKFYDMGTFEIVTTQNSFETGDIIAFMGFGKIRSGIVMKIVEKDGKITVSGNDLKGIYSFRYNHTELNFENQTPYVILLSLFASFLNNEERKIENLKNISETIAMDSITYTAKTGFLNEIIKDISQSYEVGTEIEFDLNCLNFKILKGIDRTQTIRFGRRFHNIDNVEYKKDISGTYNVAFYKDEEENVCSLGNEKGILRRECYQDKNPQEYLNEKAPSETLRAEANDRYAYGVDYDLGDYVTVCHRDLQTVKQITEIKEVHEKGGSFVVPIFGSEKENPIKKIIMS